MYINSGISFIILILLSSCYQPKRDCKAFKDGEFSFTSVINEEEVTTTFVRKGNLEIDYFNGKTDSSSVRWINDCEYIVKKLRPRNKAEEKSVHMKILTTTDKSYTFEYNLVGDNKKSKGIAIKIN
jgi:hypothetical protein